MGKWRDEQTELFLDSETILYDTAMVDIHLSKCIEYTISRVYLNVNYGFCVIIMCMFTDCKIYTIPVWDVGGEVCGCVRSGVYGNAVPSAQFFYEL